MQINRDSDMCEKKEIHRIVSWSKSGGRKGEGKGEGHGQVQE